MVSINAHVLQRGGWFLDPVRRHWHRAQGCLPDQQVLDPDGDPAAPAEGQLCGTTAALNCGLYTQGSAIVCIVSPSKKKYTTADSYGQLYDQLKAGAERTADVWYALPFDCSASSQYQALCARLPLQLASDAANLHLYSDPEDAVSRNIFVFVRMSDKLLRRAGQRKQRKTSVFFQLGRFQYVGASQDRRRLLLRPRAQRATRLARPATSARDTGAASCLLDDAAGLLPVPPEAAAASLQAAAACPGSGSSHRQRPGRNPRDVLRTDPPRV